MADKESFLVGLKGIKINLPIIVSFPFDGEYYAMREIVEIEVEFTRIHNISCTFTHIGYCSKGKHVVLFHELNMPPLSEEALNTLLDRYGYTAEDKKKMFSYYNDDSSQYICGL